MTTLKGVTLTKGHLSSNGGLRGHSVGDKFPVVLGMQGNPHSNRLFWFAQAPDGAEMIFSSYELASAAADAWHMLRKSFQRGSDAVGITFEIRKVFSNEDEEGNTNCESYVLHDNSVGDGDFFGLYAINAAGVYEWLADGDSALQLGRIVAFLTKAIIKTEYASLQVNARQGGNPISMTLEEFYNYQSDGWITDTSKVDDYWALDTAMSERMGKDWQSISKFYCYCRG